MFIPVPVLATTEVIYSTTFDDRDAVRSEWVFEGNIRFRTGPNRRESVRAVRIARASSMSLDFNIPSGTRNLAVQFWLRIGASSFSQAPVDDAFVALSWVNPSDESVVHILHAGSEGAGDILRPLVNIPAGQFRSPNGRLSIFTIDEAGRYYVDNLSITATLGAAHFSIEPAQDNASVCVPNEVVISALDSDGSVISDFEGVVDISTSTSHGDWSMVVPNGRLEVGDSDSGVASYRFEASDQGSVRLLLSNEHAESLTVRVAERDTSTNTVSQSIRYAENAFVLDFPPAAERDVIAYRAHAVSVSMVRRDRTHGDCGVASQYEVDHADIRLTSSSGDTMAVAPLLMIDDDTFTASATFEALPLAFESGLAQFQIFTRDVGRFTISLRDSSGSFSSDSILGDSGELLSRPFGIWLDLPGNTAALDHNGDVFRRAGEDFSLNAAAVGWQSDDDQDGDGVADGHSDSDAANRVDLSDNPRLPSFSREGTPASVRLTARPVLPENVSHSELTGNVVLSQFTNGQRSETQLQYSNVGIMEIEARIDGNAYLGSGIAIGQRIQGRSGLVGRFIPDHFTLADADIEPACLPGGFSHMAQDFFAAATVSAVNAEGVIADGYHEDFVKLDGELQGNRVFQASGLSGRLFTSAETLLFNQGQARYRASLQLLRNSEPDGPWRDVPIGLSLLDEDDVGIAVSSLNLDLDGVNGSDPDHVLLGISDFYFSRINLPNAHGPETQDLLSNLHIESWHGHSFQRNQADSCSQLARRDIQYVQTGDLSDDSNRTVDVGTGNSTGFFESLGSDSIQFLDGDAGQFFSAPGLGHRGTIDVDVDVSAYPWLQFDWDQDGEHNDIRLPRAQFRFGANRGHDRIVYWRELAR
ncbi:DUF6701 domain-containing protein [Pseudoteredinibacter isoporae]|uniref:DUF6701 domain-containing protein n=1 Tax=Pseudoteredinibacter isoporae TaxID=570281 RepID=UPI003109A9EA